tara:strand:+ start:3318 stop:3842 length:525 start_codon:yes stop_codon:yes gene_type:complete
MIKVDNIFPNLIAVKNLNLSNFKITGKKFKKTFESNVKTTLNGDTLLDEKSINYLNLELKNILSHLLKPYCKNFVFNVTKIWINKYEKNDYQGAHIHGSDFSFIIYYKGNSNTVFNSPSKNILQCFDEVIFDISYEPNLKQNDIIVFPSYLEHWVRPNSNTTTVSGNIKVINKN